MSALLDMTGYENEDGECLDLTFTQRLMGFAATSIIGIFSGILSIIAISLIRIRKFSLLFAIFNLMTLSSTGFLFGFKKQLRSMFEAKRIYAAIGMIFGMFTTFMFAMKWKKLIGVIIGFLIEVVSFSYYALSYLPMGTTLFHKCFF